MSDTPALEVTSLRFRYGRRQPWVVEIPSLSLDAYAGTYTDSLFGPVEVRYESGSPGGEERLVLYRSDFLTADLDHWHYDVFEATWRKQWLGPDRVIFLLGTDGTATELRMWGRTLRRVAETE